MALNIKNPEVERLVEEVAAMTGESKTEAVRRALDERRVRLSYRIDSESRATRLTRFLESEVWPTVPDAERGRCLTKVAEENLLGYGPDGV